MLLPPHRTHCPSQYPGSICYYTTGAHWPVVNSLHPFNDNHFPASCRRGSTAFVYEASTDQALGTRSMIRIRGDMVHRDSSATNSRNQQKHRESWRMSASRTARHENYYKYSEVCNVTLRLLLRRSQDTKGSAQAKSLVHLLDPLNRASLNEPPIKIDIEACCEQDYFVLDAGQGFRGSVKSNSEYRYMRTPASKA